MKRLAKQNHEYEKVIDYIRNQIEAENLKELYEAIANAQEAVFKTGIGRVYTVIKVDDRRDLENRTLDAKIDTVNKMLK